MFLPKTIRLKRRYTGVGGNTPVAPIFKLLRINKMMSYEVSSVRPVLQSENITAKRLMLRCLEFLPYTIYQSGTSSNGCRPNEKTAWAIEKFGELWKHHEIELDLTLICSMGRHGTVVPSTNITLEREFAPLGQFNKVLIRWSWDGPRERQDYFGRSEVVKRTLRTAPGQTWVGQRQEKS